MSSITPETKSFMTSLCFGEIDEDLIYPYPKMRSQDGELLKGVVTSLEQLLKPQDKDFRKWDRAGELPTELIEELKQFGLFSLVIPEEFGGMGMNATVVLAHAAGGGQATTARWR